MKKLDDSNPGIFEKFAKYLNEKKCKKELNLMKQSKR